MWCFLYKKLFIQIQNICNKCGAFFTEIHTMNKVVHKICKNDLAENIELCYLPFKDVAITFSTKNHFN